MAGSAESRCKTAPAGPAFLAELGVEMFQEAQIDPDRPPSVHRSDVVADSVVAIFAHVGTHPVADGDAAHSGATRTSGQSP